MASAIFTVAQAQKARYFLEQAVYTGWPFDGTGSTSSLSTGTTPLIQARQWNTRGQPTWQVDVAMVQSSRDTSGNTIFDFAADPSDQVGGFTQATGNTAAAHTRYLQEPAKISGVYNVQAQLINNNASATSAWQTNLGIRLRRLTAIDKLLAQRDGLAGEGWYALTPQETTALENLNIIDAAGNVTMSGLDTLKAVVQAGYPGPYSSERLKDVLFRSRFYQEAPDWYYPTVASGAAQFAMYSAALTGPTTGRFPVLTAIGIPGASNVAVSISRDNVSYVTVQGLAFQQVDDSDWCFFLPALDNLQLSSQTGQGGAGGATGIRAQVGWCSMSETLAVLFDRVKSRDELSDPYVFDKAIAGLFI